MSLLFSIAGAFSIVADLGCRVAVVVVVATLVRRHRPSSHRALLAWSIASLGWAICVQVGYGAIRYGMQSASVDDFMVAESAISITSTSVHVALTTFLLYSLVALSRGSGAVAGVDFGR